MTTTKTTLSRILFFLYLCCIAFLCFARLGDMSAMEHSLAGIPTDKIAHFLMFLPMPILTYLSFDHRDRRPGKTVLFAFLTILSGCAIAYGTELIQAKIPYRSFDMKDFYADSVAVVLSALMTMIIALSKKSR